MSKEDIDAREASPTNHFINQCHDGHNYELVVRELATPHVWHTYFHELAKAMNAFGQFPEGWHVSLIPLNEAADEEMWK